MMLPEDIVLPFKTRDRLTDPYVIADEDIFTRIDSLVRFAVVYQMRIRPS